MRTSNAQTVGLLAPKGNTAIVEDFERLLPEDVDLRVGRLYRDGERTARERLFDMAAHIEEAVEELGKEPLDVVAFGCTGGSFIGGPGYDRDLASRIASASGGAQAAVTATAVVDALNVLGAKRVSVCSPYSGDWAFANDILRRFYEDAGFEILEIDATEVGESLTMESALEIATWVDRPESDAVFISCTDFNGALEAADEIEAELGKPVVTSNQATFWSSMQKLGRSEPKSTGGRLLREGVPIRT